MRLGSPRIHYRLTDSTNARARELAARGAAHGTLVTATAQTAGRGRQGRSWADTAGRSLLCSVVVREPSPLLSLVAGVAVAEVCGADAALKWPNDVLLDGRKVAGILVEGRPQEGWAVIGIGLNVAVQVEELPAELRQRAGTLGLQPADLEAVLARLMDALGRWLAADPGAVLAAVRSHDALLGQPVSWAGGSGVGAGIDADGHLVVGLPAGGTAVLDAGEVHLGASDAQR